MVTLNGLELDRSVYLEDLYSNSEVSSSQKRSIGGNSFLFVSTKIGGREFSLGTIVASIGTQGLFQQHIIEQIKAMERQATAVVLDYRGDIYNVVITGSTFEPLFQNQLESPTKLYTGNINLVEV